MSFQWIFDKAESLSINKKQMVATTTSRDGSVRAVTRGAIPKRITVKLPDGLRWSDIKSDIAAAEALDKVTTATVSISAAGMGWYYTGGTVPGSPESYTVRCVEFPEWTLSGRNQVSWSGPFVFVEVFD